MKVTLVVAVYNPGTDITELLTSIDQQSMPSTEFEVIFADDDSTDGTRERLHEWAASRPHVRVLHSTPNSGWPGKPRNLGIDAAQGEFLFFADNDDKLAPRALEWMYDYAQETGADIVIPKEVGVGPGRGVPRHVFRKNIKDAKLGKDPVLAIMTPHKLVRTEMVRAHGIRFPEGRVRLEDHLFFIKCYFAAERISILADKLCYYWMRRSTGDDNASMTQFDPARYVQCVEEILEVIEANTEPGPLRDKLYAHWYDRKVLVRLRGGALLNKSVEYQETLFREHRRVRERFGLGEKQWPWLGAGARLRSHMLANNTLDDIRIVGDAERGVTSRITVDEVAWTDDDKIRVLVHGRLIYSDGRAIRTVTEGDTVYWDTHHFVPDLELPKIDISDQTVGMSVLVVDRESLAVDYAPGTSERIEGDTLEATTEVLIDARQLAEQHPKGGYLDLRGRVVGAGWASEYRVPLHGQPLPPPRLVGGMMVWPYATRGAKNLSVAVRDPGRFAAEREAEIKRQQSVAGRSRTFAEAAESRSRAGARDLKRLGRLVRRRLQRVQRQVSRMASRR
ncbi:glycosyltransferase family 2 protein [Demetria terragena]|uniref:glycosyltransferase family 2 protein n=1 Tax=Demetria terragena TaxID=63959 RepID=UPI00146155A3|nr:glycosyltransferase family A protein [Demetria terragena]